MLYTNVSNEDEYRGMMETISLLSVPELKEKLMDGINTPIADCVSESGVEW